MSRHTIGDRGRLAKPLQTRCCGRTIPEGTEVEVYYQKSPNRVTVAVEPPRSFLTCGHSFVPIHGATVDDLVSSIRGMPSSGPLNAIPTLPPAREAHTVKLSGVWFEGET